MVLHSFFEMQCRIVGAHILRGICVVQGHSDGGGDIGIYPPKSAQVNFLWGKNDIRMAIQQFYTPQKTLYPPKQISGYAPADDNIHLTHHTISTRYNARYEHAGDQSHIWCQKCQPFVIIYQLQSISAL